MANINILPGFVRKSEVFALFEYPLGDRCLSLIPIINQNTNVLNAYQRKKVGVYELQYDFIGSHHLVVFMVDDVAVPNIAWSLRRIKWICGAIL